jgi:acetyltransferase
MRMLNELTPDMLVRFTQIDYDREMAFIALHQPTTGQDSGDELEVGVTRYSLEPDGESAEFALVVADDWHSNGVGSQLLEILIDYARQRGVRVLFGEVLLQNTPMRQLAQRMGFTEQVLETDQDMVRIARHLS